MAIDMDGLEEYVVIHYRKGGTAEGELVGTVVLHLTDANKNDVESKKTVYIIMDAKWFTAEHAINKVTNPYKPTRDKFLLDGSWEKDPRPEDDDMINGGGLELHDKVFTTKQLADRFSDASTESSGFIVPPLQPNVQLFAENSVELTPKIKQMLRETIYVNMLLHPSAEFEIVGYTDAVGTDADNKALGLLRAEAVKAYLESLEGIDSGRLKTSSEGESQATGDSDDGKKSDRKVLIVPVVE
jgi:outer membrane protein OmpA-like peptidoglycan-associated protein